MDLAERSVEVILAGQSRSGGYVACPNFEQYHAYLGALRRRGDATRWDEAAGLVKRGDAWYSDNWESARYKLRVRAETFFGKIELQRSAR